MRSGRERGPATGADPLRFALRARRAAIDRVTRFTSAEAQATLEAAKGPQRARFQRCAAEAAGAYAAIRDHVDGGSLAPAWARYARRLEEDLLPNPPFDFLRHPVLMETMEVRGRRMLDRTVARLERGMSRARLAELLEEDLVGMPALACRRYATSHTIVHHLHHLERFGAATGRDWRTLSSIVELGGGYGSLARLIRRQARQRLTYVILDMPISALLQWLYLSTIFGPEEVELVTSERLPKPGCISIVPIGLARRVDLRAELFVSTWGMSESAHAVQRWILDRDWFGAPHLLIAFQHASRDFPDLDSTARFVKEAGASLEPLGVARGSTYAFR